MAQHPVPSGLPSSQPHGELVDLAARPQLITAQHRATPANLTATRHLSTERVCFHALSYRLCHYDVVAQREKRSVSLPPELAKAVEEAARAEGTTFSAWLAQTAAHRLKLEAGRQALTEWERENGPLTEAELAEGRARARASLGREPADAAEP